MPEAAADHLALAGAGPLEQPEARSAWVAAGHCVHAGVESLDRLPAAVWIEACRTGGSVGLGPEIGFRTTGEGDVKVEKLLARQPEVRYPYCLGGERACPPEDCGGVWGYAYLLAALEAPDDPESAERLQWAGPFDPEKFDLDTVNAVRPAVAHVVQVRESRACLGRRIGQRDHARVLDLTAEGPQDFGSVSL